MIIDNFDVIDKFLQFEKGYFYKFECLIRNTDGQNSLYEQGYSKVNKNILIKSWYVDNSVYYEKIKTQMKSLCDLTGGRLYVTLDRKSTLKLIQQIIMSLTQFLYDKIEIKDLDLDMKTISKMLASKSSIKETSDKSHRTIMFDIDCKDQSILSIVYKYIQSKGQTAYTLNTKKGYHVFCFKKFDYSDWYSYMSLIYNCTQGDVEPQDIKNVVSVKDNEIGLIYFNKTEE